MPIKKVIKEALRPTTWPSTTYSEDYYTVKDPKQVIQNDKFYLPL